MAPQTPPRPARPREAGAAPHPPRPPPPPAETGARPRSPRPPAIPALQQALEGEHVEPASELERDLTLVTDADEAVMLVQAQGGLVLGGDARDHRAVAASLRVRDQRVEDESAQPLAAPAVLH